MSDIRRSELDHLEYFLRQWYGSEAGRGEIAAYLPKEEKFSAPLERVFRALVPEKDAKIEAISMIWSDIVGATLSQRCRPISFRGTAMVIECDRQAYFVELMRKKKHILSRIHELMSATFCTELCYVPLGFSAE